MMRIQIWAANMQRAGELAATMNLSLRHWDYAGKDWRGIEWADVGTVMDKYDDMEDRIRRLEK
jgi:hypothetical protein